MKGLLFLCVANSARSQMAEAIARRRAPPGLGIWSAGSAPTAVNPMTVHVLREIDIDAGAQRAKGLDAIPAGDVDTVVTLCAEEVCPVFPGNVRRLHWPLPDPAAAPGDEEAHLMAFRAVRDEISKRIEALFNTQ
jgi:protein-tyrosine-phosphatase